MINKILFLDSVAIFATAIWGCLESFTNELQTPFFLHREKGLVDFFVLPVFSVLLRVRGKDWNGGGAVLKGGGSTAFRMQA